MKNTLLKAYRFWFGELSSAKDFPSEKAKIWFSGGDEVDTYLKDQFQATLEGLDLENTTALENEFAGYDRVLKTGMILLLDQFPRNIFRGSARSFDFDPLARKLVRNLHARGFAEFYPIEKTFLFLPFEHSEDIADQNLAVDLYQKLADEVDAPLKQTFIGFLDYARRHQVVVEKFGRFPHRNKILDRTSTPEEIEFLKQHPMGF